MNLHSRCLIAWVALIPAALFVTYQLSLGLTSHPTDEGAAHEARAGHDG